MAIELTPSQDLKAFRKAANLRIGQRPKAGFHDLRHTNATLSLLLGDNIKSVSENLGHASPEFTLKVYAHVNEEMQQKSKATMDTLYELVKPKEETQNSAEEK